MSPEHSSKPAPIKPYEVFGFTEKERAQWRISADRFDEILENRHTTIHTIEPASNTYGEFLFVTASRSRDEGRVYMGFYGLGYHEYRERWLVDEWYWFQERHSKELLRQQIPLEEAKTRIEERIEDIRPDIAEDTQTPRGELFEFLAELGDEDGALVAFQDLDEVFKFTPDEQPEDKPPPPIGENLLDDHSREKLPELYSGEEKGLDALAQVKFFTPDSNWTWYASEFDGEDIFFGLVIGFAIEFGYFSLQELQEVRGPWGLPIERDIHFKPKTLRELKNHHEELRNGGSFEDI
jgi:hypothetical protein